MNCNVCGSANLIEGSVIGVSGITSSYFFEPKDRPILNKIFSIDRQNVSSYACIHCGNLQFTVNFDEDARRKYAEFKGEPSSLTGTSE